MVVMIKLKNLLNILNKDEIGEPPWNYYFLKTLPESEYPKYLAKIYHYRTCEKLPLSLKLKIENGKLKINYFIDKKRCKTFNQKIQWLKLYGVTPLMRDCTDKVKVRDYVKEKIGSEYLKPVLQIIPNESHETMRCYCEQTNNHLMSAWQSIEESEHTIDLPREKRNLGLPFSRQRVTQNVVIRSQ